MRTSWTVPLCGCLQDCCIVLAVVCLPCGFCVVQGKAVSSATSENCCVPCCCPIVLCCVGAAINRGRIRDSFLIEGSLLEDLCVHIFCSPCGVCQEYLEAKARAR